MLTRRWRLPVMAAIPILAVAVWTLIGTTPGTEGGGSAATIAIGSATVAPGGQVTVDLTVTPDQGPSVGALDLAVNYDNSVLTATGCTAPYGACNPSFDQDTLLYSMSNISGLSGVVGTVTFAAIGADGMSSPLDLVVTSCGDTVGDPITCTDADGQISVVALTPTPTPTPSPPTPTPTPIPSQTWGDVDCNGVVNPVDALKILRWHALLPVSQTQPCPVIGAPYP